MFWEPLRKKGQEQAIPYAIFLQLVWNRGKYIVVVMDLLIR